MTLTYIFKVTHFETWISRKRWELPKNPKVRFFRDWYLPSNGTIANVVLRDLDLQFQCQTFACYAFIKIYRKRMSQQIFLDSHGPRRGVALVVNRKSTIFNPGQPISVPIFNGFVVKLYLKTYFGCCIICLYHIFVKKTTSTND